MLVHENFNPLPLSKSDYHARQLMLKETQLDYEAVMSSIEIIRKTRGGNWPTADLTYEDDMIDLGWHQREFEFKNSFAYTVMNNDESECLGCFYLYPVNFRKVVPQNKGYDVDVSWWVTAKMYEQGFYDRLGLDIAEWLKQWPFKKPYFSNLELPKQIQN